MWFPDLDMAEREAREIAAEIASKLGWESASAITISVSKERLSSEVKPAHPRGDRLMFASFRARHNNSACILASGRFEESRLALSLPWRKP